MHALRIDRDRSILATALAAAVTVCLLADPAPAQELPPAATSQPISQPATQPTAATQPTTQAAPTTQATTQAAGVPLFGRPDDDKPLWGDGGDDSEGLLGRLAGSALAVAVLGVIAWIVVKKVMPRVAAQQGRRLRVVETVYLGPKKTVHVVRVGSQEFLVGSSAERISMLAELHREPEASSFAEALAATQEDQP